MKKKFELYVAHIIINCADADVKLPFCNVINVWTQYVGPGYDPVLGFHILTVESNEPDAKLPFGNVTNVQTAFVCSVNV